MIHQFSSEKYGKVRLLRLFHNVTGKNMHFFLLLSSWGQWKCNKCKIGFAWSPLTPHDECNIRRRKCPWTELSMSLSYCSNDWNQVGTTIRKCGICGLRNDSSVITCYTWMTLWRVETRCTSAIFHQLFTYRQRI